MPATPDPKPTLTYASPVVKTPRQRPQWMHVPLAFLTAITVALFLMIAAALVMFLVAQLRAR